MKAALHRAVGYFSDFPFGVRVKLLRRLTAGSQGQYLNRYAHTLWAVLKKR